jgi:diaminohydroxyphosphoribosylaminopyrimidine deaminase/5-amino-6-(5-phosphoribosylamino)uracil reductase
VSRGLVAAMISEDADVPWMKCALAEAERGRGRVEPNPLTGAVLVKDGCFLGSGHHDRFGGPHAEIVALERVGNQAKGATLYVTLEPCCHHGKTPPCTSAILAAGVVRVVAAMRDPFPKVNGQGFALLEAAGVVVESHCLEQAARRLNAPFLKHVTTGLPYVTAKWAMTLDGKTAVENGDSRWISSESSRQQVHQLRGRMDAIVAGIGTVVADDPLLTARPAGPRLATRVVLDSHAQLPLSSRLVQTAAECPVLVAVTNTADPLRCAKLREHGCEVVVFPDSAKVPVIALLEELSRREMTNVLVEGGGRVLGSFLDAQQVDAVDVFIAPIVEGGDHANTSIRGEGCQTISDALRADGVTVTQVGSDVRLRGHLPQPWRKLASFPGG